MSKTFISAVFLTIFFSFNSIAFSQEDKPAKVRGRVTNYFGYPLEEVEVKFFLLEKKSSEYLSTQGKFIKSVFTGKDGQYQISELPWGEYRVTSSASGFPTAEVWRFYLSRNAERILDLGLKIGITHGLLQLKVFGKVKQRNGNPIEDATVTLVNAFDATEIIQARTNKDGKYQFEFIQPGQNVTYVSKQDFSVNTSSFLINAFGTSQYSDTETDKKIDVELLPLSKFGVKK